MMVASFKGRALSVAGAYGVIAAGALVGGLLRLLGFFERPTAPYHCYDWQPQTAAALTVYLLIAPLAAGFAPSKVRTMLVCVVGFLAFVLATFLWSYTKIVPCSPM